MSNEASTWAFSIATLKSGPKFVLVALANYADEEHTCFPGVPKIAAMTGIAESSVREHLKVLTERGLIEVERRHRSDGSRTSNRYRLAVGQEPESGGRPSAGIRGGLAPESGGPTAGIRRAHHTHQVKHQGDTSAVARASASDPFEEVWAAWPRKDGKKPARLAWARAVKRAPVAQVRAAALGHCRAWSGWPPGDVQFVPHMATWLNQDRWDDPVPNPRSAHRGNIVDAGREVDAALRTREEAGQWTPEKRMSSSPALGS